MQPNNVVHVIDDDEAVRESLAFLLKTARLDVRTYDSAMTFLSSLPNADSGCIITDVRMPEISGVDLLRRLRELKVGMPVIVITGHGDVQLAVEAMKIGAADFIEKPFDDELLLAAVRSALGRWEKGAQQESERTKLLDKLATLSPRERDVLEGLVAGKPNKIIAFDLGIRPRTVEIYRANVMTKMNAGSLSELVRMALLANVLKTTSDN
jgi:two-component system, LuxR family, response regulator FixJ